MFLELCIFLFILCGYIVFIPLYGHCSSSEYVLSEFKTLIMWSWSLSVCIPTDSVQYYWLCLLSVWATVHNYIQYYIIGYVSGGTTPNDL